MREDQTRVYRLRQNTAATGLSTPDERSRLRQRPEQGCEFTLVPGRAF